MDIDITEFVMGEDPSEYSASAMELGDNAGPITWNNARREAARKPLLTTPAHFKALRAWAKSTGAWDAKERAAWSKEDCNALFIQIISGDMREADMAGGFMDEFDWEEYHERAKEGQIAGNIFLCDIPDTPYYGRIFYSLED